MLLPFRLCPSHAQFRLPLSLYSCGLHEQAHQYRPEGYPALQCFMNFGGYGTFQLPDNQELVLPPGHALLLPAGTPHEYSPAPAQTWLLGFISIRGASTDSIIQSCNLPIMKIFPIAPAATKSLGEQLHAIWERSVMDEPEAEEQLSADLYAFLLHLSKSALHQNRQLPAGAYSSAGHALKTAVAYMKQHYSEQLMMANIAHAVGYSVQHFQRIFREAYGMNPLAYLQRIRLQQAAAWLEGGPEPGIQEIASRLGMETSYFIRMFKKQFGVTPGLFRKTYSRRAADPEGERTTEF